MDNMERKIKNLLLANLAVITVAVCALAAHKFFSGDIFSRVKGEECDHNGNHYAELAPSYTSSGTKEYYVCCLCHQHFLGEVVADGQPAQLWKNTSDTFAANPYSGYNTETLVQCHGNFGSENNTVTDYKFYSSGDHLVSSVTFNDRNTWTINFDGSFSANESVTIYRGSYFVIDSVTYTLTESYNFKREANYYYVTILDAGYKVVPEGHWTDLGVAPKIEDPNDDRYIAQKELPAGKCAITGIRYQTPDASQVQLNVVSDCEEFGDYTNFAADETGFNLIQGGVATKRWANWFQVAKTDTGLLLTPVFYNVTLEDGEIWGLAADSIFLFQDPNNPNATVTRELLSTIRLQYSATTTSWTML